MKIFEIVTPTGLDVFEGTKKECVEYLKQAIKKGSKPGFLVIKEKEEEKMNNQYLVIVQHAYQVPQNKWSNVRWFQDMHRYYQTKKEATEALQRYIRKEKDVVAWKIRMRKVTDFKDVEEGTT